MQLEWKEYVSGLSLAKAGYGMLWLFCIVFLIVWFFKRYRRGRRLFLASAFLGILVFCPLTAVALLKIYTPFYTWSDLQFLFPIMLLSAFLGTEAFVYIKKIAVPGLRVGGYANTIIGIVLLVLLFLSATNFKVFNNISQQHENGVPIEAYELFEALDKAVSQEEILLAAPSEYLQYTRLYKASWCPLYGRDLWDGRAASYIYSGYGEEYEYFTILDTLWLSEQEYAQVHAWLEEGVLDCMIVPVYWLEKVLPVSGYEAVGLADIYVGIIKEDLLVK